jgi:hypothetical protein
MPELKYKILTISMYRKDLERLDAMVKDMKGKGVSRASRSALIRYALSMLDPNHIPLDWCLEGKIPGQEDKKSGL